MTWRRIFKALSLAVVGLAVILLAASPGRLAAQGGPITLDGDGGDWNPAWQVATDGLDVSITGTRDHPHDAPTYARSGYDATALWAYYDAAGATWYFRLDVDGRPGDSDSQTGTAGNPGVGTHGPDSGPLVSASFTDGNGLGTSETYRLGFTYELPASGVSVMSAELGPGAGILPGTPSALSGLVGQGIYGTGVNPGVIEFAFAQAVLFPSGASPENELWLSAQAGDNQDNVSDDTVPVVLLTAMDLDLAAACSTIPAAVSVGDQVALAVDYVVPSAMAMDHLNDVVLTANVPAGTTFVSATNGGAESGGVITWRLGNLNSGTSARVSFTVRLDTLGTITVQTGLRSAEGLRDVATTQCAVAAPVQPSTPSAVPEASTLILLSSAVSGLAGYAALQIRARRRK
ncbi:MAG: hypothetical protein JW850_19885 [Thermoflexales bacterium]|nr:hypothetical protein [Thermoflexales bacterium]